MRASFIYLTDSCIDIINRLTLSVFHHTEKYWFLPTLGGVSIFYENPRFDSIGANNRYGC